MALDIESIATDVFRQLQAHLPTQLATVIGATDNTVPIPSPRREDYFIGEPAEFEAYRTPAVFFLANTTEFVDEGTGREWANIEKQRHGVWLDVLLENTDRTKLTKACWRMARALRACLHDQELTPSAITSRSMKTFVPRVEYGVMFTNQHTTQKQFRKDVLVRLDIHHWDSLLPMAGAPVVTQAVSATTIAANVAESLLTTTNATTLISYTPTTTGNFLMHAYYRVVTGATTLLLTAAWTDATGAQSATLVTDTQSVGSYTVTPVFFSAVANSPITLTATAGTANRIYVSASLEAL